MAQKPRYGGSFMAKKATNLTDTSKLPNNMRQPISAPPRGAQPQAGLVERAAQARAKSPAAGAPPIPSTGLPARAGGGMPDIPQEIKDKFTAFTPTGTPSAPAAPTGAPVGAVPAGATAGVPAGAPPPSERVIEGAVGGPPPTYGGKVIDLEGVDLEQLKKAWSGFAPTAPAPQWEQDDAAREALMALQAIKEKGPEGYQWTEEEAAAQWLESQQQSQWMKLEQAKLGGKQKSARGKPYMVSQTMIDIETIRSYNDKVLKDKISANDQYLKELQTWMSFYGNTVSEENRQKIYEDMAKRQDEQWALQKEGEAWMHYANWLTGEEATRSESGVIGWIFEQWGKGAPWWWIQENLSTAGSGDNKYGVLVDPDAEWEGEGGKGSYEDYQSDLYNWLETGEGEKPDPKDYGHSGASTLGPGGQKPAGKKTAGNKMKDMFLGEDDEALDDEGAYTGAPGATFDEAWDSLTQSEKDKEVNDAAEEMAKGLLSDPDFMWDKEHMLGGNMNERISYYLAQKWGLPVGKGGGTEYNTALHWMMLDPKGAEQYNAVWQAIKEKMDAHLDDPEFKAKHGGYDY